MVFRDNNFPIIASAKKKEMDLHGKAWCFCVFW